MPEPQNHARSLFEALADAGSPSARLWAPDASVALDALAHGTSLGGALASPRGRSVLVATGRQLAAALALVELDGVARRLTLCPPGLSAEHPSHVTASVGVDARAFAQSTGKLVETRSTPPAARSRRPRRTPRERP